MTAPGMLNTQYILITTFCMGNVLQVGLDVRKQVSAVIETVKCKNGEKKRVNLGSGIENWREIPEICQIGFGDNLYIYCLSCFALNT